MGKALIPGILDSPFQSGRSEVWSVWFGQCYSCLSKSPQVPGRFEGKSTQTQAGTGLNPTTIFESFLPSEFFGLNTHKVNVFVLGLLQGKLRKLTNSSTGRRIKQFNPTPATSEQKCEKLLFCVSTMADSQRSLNLWFVGSKPQL